MARITLKGKTVFITGGSSGIGKELARCFAEQGANLILMSREGKKKVLAEYAESLGKKYAVKTWTVTADLSRPEGPREAYDQVKAIAPQIDVLVNNAGMISFGLFHELSADEQDRIISVNARAYMLMMRFFIPDMVARKSGSVLNVCSFSAFVPTPRHSVYGATKAFIQSMSEAVNEEMKGTGVGVFTLNPGYTDTPLLQSGGFPKKLRFYRFAGKGDSATVAEKGVQAFMRGKKVFIPEPHLRFLAFMNRFTPKRFINAISELMVKGV